MYFKKTGWLAILLLCACQPAPAVKAPDYTPEIWQIHMTSTLDWMRPYMSDCIQNHPEANLLVLETSPEFFDRETDTFQFRWGAAEQISGYSAILGEEDLLVIIHPDNPLKDMSIDQIHDIYTGKVTRWEEITNDFEGEISAWSYSTNEDIQIIFEKAIDTTQLSARVYIAPDSQAVLQSVAASSNAIGYITGHWYYQGVQGVMISDLDDRFRIHPILVTTTEEPKNNRLEWLHCLQDAIQPELHY